MDKLCKACDTPLSQALADLDADYHVICFPEEEWREWLKKLGAADDQV